jgi:hypothetical protein
MFFLYQRRQQLRDAEANSSAMSVLSRVRFEELKAQGDELCLRVKHSQVRALKRDALCTHSNACSRRAQIDVRALAVHKMFFASRQPFQSDAQTVLYVVGRFYAGDWCVAE